MKLIGLLLLFTDKKGVFYCKARVATSLSSFNAD
jgi:hypothetical protein